LEWNRVSHHRGLPSKIIFKEVAEYRPLFLRKITVLQKKTLFREQFLFSC